jgi:UDP-N-acetylmuramate--alanine ligase
MSGIARLLLARGVGVSGSDLKDSASLRALRGAGADVAVGHHRGAVDGADVVVVSSAIPESNVELREAREAGIEILTRAEVLAGLMAGHRAVAVAGTHGKTTTTSMVAVMLSRLGLDPTFVIGGDLNESGSGAVHGGGDLFVAEADESDGSFLRYRPEVAVITNVEEDHLDHYRGREEIEEAFARFAGQARSVVACGDDPGVRRSLAGLDRDRQLRYGLGEDLDLRLVAHELTWGTATGVVEAQGRSIPVRLRVPGVHNLLNAMAALGVARVLGLPLDGAADALSSFTGVRRRFEARGTEAGATFVDDYAHHPSEVEATLLAARGGRRGRLIAVFQPHRYTRTEAMWRPLGESLADADVVVLTDVYGAGERPIPGVTGKLLVDALAEAAPGKRVVYLPRRAEIPAFLAREVRPGDLVLTLGAGDITMVAEATLDRLRDEAGTR